MTVSKIVRGVSVVLVGASIIACNSDEAGTSATIGSTGVTDVPQHGECAMQVFKPGDGPGQHYGCAGSVAGELRFKVCTLNCDGLAESPDPIPIDYYETEGANGEVEFYSDDPTGGPRVRTCCEPEIESAPFGEEKGDDACRLDCAHAACLDALAQFEALKNDPPSDITELCPTQKCVNRVIESFTHWHSTLLDNFDTCVAVAQDAQSPVYFKLGSPHCIGDDPPAGCLFDAELELKCMSANIDFNTNVGTCTAAKNQPPELKERQCTINGAEVEISEGANTVTPAGTGSATFEHHDCADPLCMLKINTLYLELEPVVYGTSTLENINIELIGPAPGWSDSSSQDLEFGAGAFHVRVTGNIDDGVSLTPFEVFTSSTTIAVGEHDDDFLLLDDVTFESGGYTFTASITDSECGPPVI